MCDSPTYNQPAQPSYGEGLADALKAQAELLTGTGEFEDIGSLESLLPLEESIRRKTAQTDTDILRQTLLGNRQEVTTGTYDNEGRLVVGFTDAETGEAVTGKYKIQTSSVAASKGKVASTNFSLIDTTTGDTITTQNVPNSRLPFQKSGPGTPNPGGLSYDTFKKYLSKSEFDKIRNAENPNALLLLGKDQKATTGDKEPQPIYAKDPNGNVITDKSKAGQTETIPASFSGDGMINLLGDSRNVQEFTTREATQDDVTAGLASEVGESITVPTGNRQAGFDADGNFLGLSALAEDIQRGNLSRQREADLADVERLSDRYRGLMEDYKPAATSGLDDARILLEQQRENLTGLRKATQADVDQGLATEVGEMFQTGTGSGGPIKMPTELDSADYAMSGDAAIGQLDSGEDTLRSALLADARGALDSGLTDREMKQVEESARARQTLMGRTFDQKGAIEEAEARIKEDNQRKMQNRAFAQSALGQEAGIQTGDAARAMTTDQFNVGATMDAERLNEQLRQQGLSNYINAVGNLAQMEDKFMLDPFQALLGRGGGNALQQGQSVFGQANYGLSSGPQYLNPEAGLGYISNMAANQANMYGAQLAADASRSSGLMGGLGAIGGGLLQGAGAAASGGTTLLSGFCWVAREVYGPANPAWMQFREWMFNESPQWFFELYRKYGERFASWISDKPLLKGIIRKWMDSKIGDK